MCRPLPIQEVKRECEAAVIKTGGGYDPKREKPYVRLGPRAACPAPTRRIMQTSEPSELPVTASARAPTPRVGYAGGLVRHATNGRNTTSVLPIGVNTMRKLTMIAATLAVLVALFTTAAYAKNFVGNNQPNTINGTPQRDVIKGLGGSDTLFGHAGDDDIHCRTGNDSISAGKGNDYVRGGKGGDVIKGLGGSDNISSHAGNDDIYGGPGHNGISAGQGNDFIVGGKGEESLRGNRGNDRIRAADGNKDYLDCGDGASDRTTADDKDTIRRCEFVNGKALLP
jgi:Ca2+-binding RTX toxin-like protein